MSEMDIKATGSGPQKHKVKVVVRVRPQLQKEDETWVQVTDEKTLLTVNHRNTEETLQYDFESVYGPSVTQSALYNGCVKPVLKKTLHGQNSSVFAYGPTGAGKTHTILGTATDPGIIPRCIKDVFSQITEQKRKSGNKEEEWTVQFSYLEIYQEKVFDLLQPRSVDLPIREDQNRNIFVTGLSEKTIANVSEFNHLFGPASRNRTTAATKLNERSSRSHSILLLKITRRQVKPPYRKQVGKMYVIDLAGSEDNRRTGNQGIRLKESGAINSSLLALGQVVDALHKAQSCIPYRGSKLTRLLQDSLGGGAHTCMIVNLAPEQRHYFDTYTTLHFARKTKKVVNTIKTNETFTQTKLAGKKRSLEHSKNAKEMTPPKKQKIEPTPFLSPLLRDQEKFRSDLKHEMLNRLEELEGRILTQMKSSTLDPAAVVVASPDSTTDHHIPGAAGDINAIENIMLQLQKFKDSGSAKKPKIKAIDTLIDNDRRPKVFSDGSSLTNRNRSPVSSSPLFMKSTVIRRKGFTSTAAKKFIDSPKPSSTSSAKENASGMNPELQKTHNDRILMILNTGTLKELQELQTVGGKRAKLIQSWRDLYGHFTQFEDLEKVTGLTAKYVANFLRSNLVQLG